MIDAKCLRFANDSPSLVINIPSWIIIEYLLDKLLSPSIWGKYSCRKKFSDKAHFICAPVKAVFCNYPRQPMQLWNFLSSFKCNYSWNKININVKTMDLMLASWQRLFINRYLKVNQIEQYIYIYKEIKSIQSSSTSQAWNCIKASNWSLRETTTL